MRVEPPVSPDRLAVVRAPFLATGAEVVDAPILQPLGLLVDLAGEALRARLFTVQGPTGDEACLRPDFTVPVARLHLDRGLASGRYVYEGKVFRASPETSDRPEEFLQIGLEQFDTGEVSTKADIDIVSLAWSACLAGDRKDMTLWLGDVGLFAAFVQGLELSPSLSARITRAAARPRLLQAELARAGGAITDVADAGLAGLLATLSPGDAGAMLEEVWALAGIDPVGGRSPAEIAQRLIGRAEAARAPTLTIGQAQAISAFLAISASPDQALSQVLKLGGANAQALRDKAGAWRTKLGQMFEAGLPVDQAQFVTALGHAFDYYDGLTFEVRSASLGDDLPLAVGGRYDGLLLRMGGPAQSRAVGAMVRPGRIVPEDSQ